MIELTGQDTGMLITINIKNITYIYPKNNGTRICFIGDTWINAKESYETVYKIIDQEWNKLNEINKKNIKGEN